MTTLEVEKATGLLDALLYNQGRRSSLNTLLEALPHQSERLDQDDILDVLDTLKISYTKTRCREDTIVGADCPALVIPETGPWYVALGRNGLSLRVAGAKDHSPKRRKCLVIRIESKAWREEDGTPQTVRMAFRVFRPMLPWLFLASFLINLLGLAAPLLIMAIYDKVIPSGSVAMLTSLVVAVLVIGLSDMCFRHARTRALAYIGARGEHQLMIALFHKLMSLPLQQLQKSDISQQLSRFRQFEALRDVFTGQIMTSLLDLPFVLIFFAVLTFLAPQVGLLTLGLVVILVILGFVTIPEQRRLDSAASDAAAKSQSAMQQAILHQRMMSDLGLQQRWLDRSLSLSEAAEDATRRARVFQAFTQSLSQSVTALATVGAIILSAYAAVNGDLSFGALIAVIALVSKILAPVQTLYCCWAQILIFSHSRNQADRVLSLPEELELGLEHSHCKDIQGAIQFSAVTFRPDPLNAPLLSQASLSCDPGEVTLIMSSDAAVRTAVLDLMDGLATPLAGTVSYDDVDLRQIARDELRTSVTYATFEKKLFYGTIAQNFRLASVSLSDCQIETALSQMGLSQDQELLPDGLETRLTDAHLAQLPDETLKALTLSRSMARPSSVYLFSEPTNGLSDQRRAAFKEWVRQQKRRSTVVIATADRSFLSIADRFVFLNGERVVLNDTGEVGRRKLKAILQAMEK
ncbi:ABC transporter transmembrane domain-containing protein [Ruegeria lacuscaerulensis]|uniref:ABC transporter transmembrane domain-containing protein n=1 Tax=Ruegeria lacuscaerulensis TaxID=55218 RepID=UPI001BE403A9|nr:ABC transporter transmembrane domain-containing protein [Ruegeria lacuscaerulensis]